jgi:hypothetical protein
MIRFQRAMRNKRQRLAFYKTPLPWRRPANYFLRGLAHIDRLTALLRLKTKSFDRPLCNESLSQNLYKMDERDTMLGL